MMADLKLSTYTALMSSLSDVKAASSVLAHETREHAEAHFAHLESLRTGMEHKRAIDDGIARSASQV